MRRYFGFLGCVLFFLVVFPCVAGPRLVIGIVVDQMRWDFLYRYESRYGLGGFRRLLADGYSFEQVLIPYLPTYTACGHATIYTGSTPAYHGIVGNEWPQAGRLRTAVWDSVFVYSPRNLQASTVGDELKWMTNGRARVFSVSMKDRASILPGGHRADMAFWWDKKVGAWQSGSFYGDSLPSWVAAVNSRREVDAYYRMGWRPLYPLGTYVQSTLDSQVYESGVVDREVSSFPYDLRGFLESGNFGAIISTPFANNLTADFAKSLIAAYDLGNNPSGVADMLAISFSATDYVGHAYGPNSVEVEDTYLRLDTVLADLLRFVEARVGRDNVLFFLTADHGVSPVPAFQRLHRFDAEAMHTSRQRADLEAHLARVFPSLRGHSLVSYWANGQIYLDRQVLRKRKLSYALVEEAIVSYLNELPEVSVAFSLHSPFLPVVGAEIVTRMRNSIHYKRSGDIQIIFQPYYIPGFWSDGKVRGTTHGAWNNYDAHIPLVFYGAGVPQGHSYERHYMTDIAPTVSAILQIPLPSNCIGSPLSEVLP